MSKISKNSQAGYGPLLLLLVGSVAYSLFFPLSQLEENSTVKNFQQLKRAKQQLLSYARSFPFTESSAGNSRLGLPPMLPCPSLENVTSDGVEKGSCGALNKTSVGLFPWKSLQTQPLFSSHGECLWYVVAGNVKRNNVQLQTHFNQDSDRWIKYQGQFAVAALLSPRESRTRSEKTERFRCRQSYEPDDIFSLDSSASFDTENKDVVINLSNAESFDVALISRSEILSHYAQSNLYQQTIDQLGNVLASCIASVSSFSSSTLQWSVPFASKVKLSDDRKVSNYNEKTGLYSGRLPYQFSGTNLQNQCSHLFADGIVSTDTNAFRQTPLFRTWLHSKNLWFLSTQPNCQLSGENCVQKGGQRFFALIVYAGQAVDEQSRVSKRFDSEDRNHVTNYLEGETLAVFAGESLLLSSPSAVSASNDRRFCLDVSNHVLRC